MSLPDDNQFSDALQRDRLTDQEAGELEAYLFHHPAERAGLEEELALNQLLRQASRAPVSSNFTARVIQAVRPPAAAAMGRRRSSWFGAWNRWIPQVTAVTSALLIGLFTYHQHQVTQRRELAENLADMARIAAGTPLDWLANFEAIQRLNQLPPDRDKELIAALQ